MKRLRLVLILGCLLGIPAGVGAFTFVYAKGFSYLSTPARLRQLPRHEPAVRRVAQERSPPHRDLRGVPPAGPGPRQVRGQGRPRLPSLDGVHAAELPRAHRDHPARPPDRAGQLRALPRVVRPRGGRGRDGARARLPALPRDRGARGGRLRPDPHTTEEWMRSNGSSGSSRVWLLTMLGFAGVAGLTVLLLALLTNIFERKQEARQPFVRVVEVTEATIDPKVWGQNWPNEYDTYLKTALPTTTKYGGRGPGASDGGPAEQKLDREPWLKRIFAGYAFSIDYRDRRGHYYALFDQEQTRRVTERKQPGACLQCHASNLAAYRFAGKGDVMKGFEVVSGMPYAEARNLKDDAGQPLIQHPIACVDCHDPKTMGVRVTRPGFINGIKALKAKQGVADYDPNRDASRQEMRSFVCGQCHEIGRASCRERV